MAYVFGDSYGGVQGARQAADELNFRVASADAARRDAAAQAANQMYQFQAQQIPANIRANAMMAYDLARGPQRDAIMDEQTKDRALEWAQNLQEQQREFGQREQDVAANQGLQREQMAAGKSDQANKSGYSEMINAINGGVITDPSQLKTFAPNATDDEIQKANAYLTTALAGKTQNYDNLVGTANIATGYVNGIAPGTPAVAGAHWYNSDKPAVAAGNYNEDQAFALAKQHKALDPRMLENLSWDAANQRFNPTIAPPAGYVPPRQRNAATAVSPLTAPPTAGWTPPPIPPTGGTGNTGWTPPPPGGGTNTFAGMLGNSAPLPVPPPSYPFSGGGVTVAPPHVPPPPPGNQRLVFDPASGRLVPAGTPPPLNNPNIYGGF